MFVYVGKQVRERTEARTEECFFDCPCDVKTERDDEHREKTGKERR